jgi:hypothetical protein
MDCKAFSPRLTALPEPDEGFAANSSSLTGQWIPLKPASTINKDGIEAPSKANGSSKH